jgi:hypothetical protein
VKVAHIFSSDLQRAVRTAEAIRTAQSPTPPETTKLEILREQDFGFYEGKKTIERPRDSNGKSGKEAHADAHRNDPGFKDVESPKAMRLRMGTFVDAHLVQLLNNVPSDGTVVVVAHGIILIYLWRVILKRFNPGNVTLAPGVQTAEGWSGLERLGGWSNTGYLDLEITPGATSNLGQSPSPPKTPSKLLDDVLPPADLSIEVKSVKPPQKFLDMSLVVNAVNSQEHLKGLKKTRGGLGSLKHDSGQKTMDSFLKKRRIE